MSHPAQEPRFTFRALREADLPLLHSWLQRPHVREWWDAPGTLDKVREEYWPASPTAGDARYLAYLLDTPVGYIQSYLAIDTGTGWWPGRHDPGSRGIDQFLGNEADVGQGIGTALVEQFAGFLFQDPAVTEIIVDPMPTNGRAIRCYEKAGFRRVGEIATPDGPALLMVLARLR